MCAKQVINGWPFPSLWTSFKAACTLRKSGWKNATDFSDLKKKKKERNPSRLHSVFSKSLRKQFRVMLFERKMSLSLVGVTSKV
ncbi:hypothetical protein XENTR_v10014659 [Xenopus tropicalis]|nr:hypothetical protein XENTR_v10014659 [Xenopus tropicalis]